MFQRGRAGLLPAPHSETQALAPASQQQRRRASNNSLGEGKAFAKPRNGAAHTYAFYTKPVYFKNQFLSYRWHIAKRNENTAAPPPAAIPMTRLGEAGRVTGGRLPVRGPRPPLHPHSRSTAGRTSAWTSRAGCAGRERGLPGDPGTGDGPMGCDREFAKRQKHWCLKTLPHCLSFPSCRA